MSSAGELVVGFPTTFAGTPATVVCAGTFCSTTEPAPTLAPSPTWMLPRIFAPALDQHAVTNFWVTVAVFFASATQRDRLQNRYPVADNGRFTND